MNKRTHLPGLLALALFIAYSTSATAQWRVGGILGMNFSTINADSEATGEDYSGRTGLVLGGIVDYELNERMGLRSGLVFVGKGGKLDDGTEFTMKYSYLEIPILFRYFFPLNSTEVVIPYATAGPSIGFRTGAKAKYGGGEIDLKDEISALDFAIALGGGVSVPLDDLLDGLLAFFEFRYQIGLANVNADTSSDEVTVKNNGLIVAIGATVPIGSN